MKDQDTLQKFLFEKYSIRGELIRLQATYQTISELHDYPASVKQFLGQALAAIGLLVGGIKLKGKLSLQVKTNGPMRLLFAQSDEGLHLRGMVHWKGDVTDIFSDAVGEGQLAINIDHANSHRPYQAIVALEGETLAKAIEKYFAQSEQLPTVLYLFANSQHVSGLLLQTMPGGPEDQLDKWQELVCLSNTITAEELLSLTNVDILHRLYHKEDVLLFDSEPVCFRCACTATRMESALRMMPYPELQQILTEESKISMQCEFCNRLYTFDQVDLDRIFTGSSFLGDSTGRH